MAKAILAVIFTILFGWFGTVLLSDLPEFGVVIAVAVMGGFIIYFNETHKED